MLEGAIFSIACFKSSSLRDTVTCILYLMAALSAFFSRKLSPSSGWCPDFFVSRRKYFCWISWLPKDECKTCLRLQTVEVSDLSFRREFRQKSIPGRCREMPAEQKAVEVNPVTILYHLLISLIKSYTYSCIQLPWRMVETCPSILFICRWNTNMCRIWPMLIRQNSI